MNYRSLRKGRSAARFVAVTVPWMLAFVLAIGISSAQASIWEYQIEKDLDLYGYIDQNAEDPPGTYLINHHASACGPTATINSFIYLQNKYGYTLSVDPSDPYADVNELGVAMGLDAYGVTPQGFLDGKQWWLGAYGNDMYYMAYQWDNDPLNAVIPDWQFIYDELSACEDVEVLFKWESGGGHCVTATSFYFNDSNDNFIFDVGEIAHLDFIDPWGGVHIGETITGNLTMDAGGYMNLTYTGGAAGTGGTGQIFMVAAESPIPEPATIIVWGLLGMLAAGFAYRRQRRAA